MLEVITDEQGNLKACLEFYVVDSEGHMDDKGVYCWINDCYVSKSAERNGCLKSFVKIIIQKYSQLQFGYFWRDKYKDKEGKWRLRVYSKRRWLNLAGGENVTKTNFR